MPVSSAFGIRVLLATIPPLAACSRHGDTGHESDVTPESEFLEVDPETIRLLTAESTKASNHVHVRDVGPGLRARRRGTAIAIGA
jgi:hypothetical protein